MLHNNGMCFHRPLAISSTQVVMWQFEQFFPLCRVHQFPHSPALRTTHFNSTPCLSFLSLSRRLSTPDTLEEAVALRQSVQGVIALVNLADAELDTGVVFGFDDAVGRAAFAGDVEIDNLSLFVLHGCWEV